MLMVQIIPCNNADNVFTVKKYWLSFLIFEIIKRANCFLKSELVLEIYAKHFR